MQRLFRQPKRIGEILDLTFHLSKKHFSSFMKIFLIIIAPFIILEALVHIYSGVSFFREVKEGASFLDQILNSIEQSDGFMETYEENGITVFIGIIILYLQTFAAAAIVLAVDRIRKGESFTVKGVIKEAFSRFGSIFVGNLLLGFIILGIIAVFGMSIAFAIIGSGSTFDLGSMVLITVLIVFGSIFGIGLLMARISFYLAVIVKEGITPGFVRSWQLSKGRTWALFGIYFVLGLIMSMITFAVEMSLLPFLGYSVLYLLIYNLFLLFTTMVMSVAYAVIFFDLKVRNDGDDILEMIDDMERKN